ncbi:hypothetical protein HGA64_04845 [Candidatus Falkowbacteria bacterium]|nr:hypothetical protein [Candidatus Falkowbacteria bacterium]
MLMIIKAKKHREKIVYFLLWTAVFMLLFSFFNHDSLAGKNILAADKCEGDWLNPAGAAGSDRFESDVVDIETAAMLQSGGKEMLCRSFGSEGKVVDKESVSGLFLKFRWLSGKKNQRIVASSTDEFIEQVVEINPPEATSTDESVVTPSDDQLDTETVASSSSLSTGSELQVPDAEVKGNETESEIQPVIINTSTPEFNVSFLEATTSEDQDAASEQVIATTTASEAIPTFIEQGGEATSTSTNFAIKIRYSINGLDWQDLTELDIDNLSDMVPLPLELLDHLDTLAISLESLGEMPQEEFISLGGVGVEFEFVGNEVDENDPNPTPNFKVDTKVQEATSTEYRSVVIRRSKLFQADDYSLWIARIDNAAISPDKWDFVAGNEMIDHTAPIAIYGNDLFWGGDSGSLYHFNIMTKGIESISEDDGVAALKFRDAGSGEVVAQSGQGGSEISFATSTQTRDEIAE